MIRMSGYCIFLIFLGASQAAQEVHQVVHYKENVHEATNLTKIFYRNSEKFKILAKSNFTSDDTKITATLNDYMDDLLVYLNDFIILNGLDPVIMPDLERTFQWRILLITYKGVMSLKDGWLQGLGTIDRNGKVTFNYEYPNLKMHIPLKFTKLLFDYEYKAKFMGLGPTGGVDGQVKGTKFTVDISLNLINLKVSLDKFKLPTLGKISLKFNGHLLTDWLMNIFVNVTIPFVKPIVNLIVKGFVRDGLDNIVLYYNDAICKILLC